MQEEEKAATSVARIAADMEARVKVGVAEARV